MPPPLRRLLPPVLSALLALAVAVPVTAYLADRRAGDVVRELRQAQAGPADRPALRDRLLAQFPDRDRAGAVLLEADRNAQASVGLAPARYRVRLICGLLRRQGEVLELVAFLSTPERAWELTLPCPSTVLTMDDELDFTGEPAGAVQVNLGFTDSSVAAFLVLVQLVPVGGG